ncbi:putative DNA damage-repair/toleration protein DRT100 [Blattamonas nauphoetae]|uniref:DNA damage-repair/toleration protein DRT100 n=1 Tax=Blattamonas nauphoetae TaxID=2049346 RepID=A0ABQ9YEV6_9EUKA|nr:putative DNA damage-repair/toleration protein DRT100 [Blattamonas nauphoetae]
MLVFCVTSLLVGITEREVLEGFYKSTGGDKWTTNTNWNTAADICTWHGISCSGKYVSSIALQGNNLVGVIPSNFGHLSGLVSFDLSKNNLGGPIPQSVGNMRNLMAIGLRENKLNGTLPDSLGRCTKLAYVHLDFNELTGTIPSSWASLKKLQVLGLVDNKLSGPVPTALSQMTALTTLALGWNSFTGPVPQSFSNLVNLEALDFANNSLSGQFPDIFRSTGKLRELILCFNDIEGPLPDSIGLLPNISVVAIAFNKLTSFPETLASNPSMYLLFLQGNNIRQKFPQAFNKTTNIEVALNKNPFICPIPEWAGWTGATCTASPNSEERATAEDRDAYYKPPPRKRPSSFKNASPSVFKYYGLSQCPDLPSMETQIFNIPSSLNPYFTLDPKFYGRPITRYPADHWCMHGQSECIGNYARLCANKIDSTKYVAFAKCQGASMKAIPSNTRACAEAAGLNWEDMKQCLWDDGRDLLRESQASADKDAAVWSPTLYIDDKKECLWNLAPCSVPGGTPDMVKKICEKIEGQKPAACN